MRERGQAVVEFMLTVVFLMLLIVGFIELVMMLYTYNTLADAAKEGVRYAIVHGSTSALPTGPSKDTASAPPYSCTSSSTNVDAVVNWVKSFAGLSLHDTSTMTVNVCYFDGDNVSPHQVQVVVSYPYTPFFGLGWPSVNVNAAAGGRIAW
jgi:Flp pilus assembly protein TadG